MDKEINARIKNNCRTLSDWTTDDPIALENELLIVEVPSENGGNSQYLMKIGDGSRKFSQLPWTSSLSADVFDWAKAQYKPEYAYSEIKNTPVTDGEYNSSTNKIATQQTIANCFSLIDDGTDYYHYALVDE